jgi:hypothetical protein
MLQQEFKMPKAMFTLIAALGVMALVASTAYAADAPKDKPAADKPAIDKPVKSRPAREVTLIGEGKCAKCLLKEGDTCQNIIEVERGKVKRVYYMTMNEVSKAFHDNLSKQAQKITVTGTVKSAAGKLEITPTKIDLVKEQP